MSASLIDEVILATTNLSTDDELATVGRSMGVAVFRGDERDVLSRFVEAIADRDADVVVRQVGDAPLVDPTVINTVIGHYLEGGCDYACNMLERSWPRGTECEVISRAALERSHRDGTRPEDREHVTVYVKTHEDQFRLRNVMAPPQENWPELRLTLDTADDYKLFQRIFDALYVPGQVLRIGQVVSWLREHPEVVELNAHVAQKAVLGRVF
jgi:spore coat polysaccharide biosynthesis protein SpsF